VRISPSEVDVTDAKAVKTIYAIRDGFGKSPWYSQIVPKPTENIFSTTDLDFHRRHRRLLGGTMSDSGLRGYLPAVTSRVELAISRMREELHQQGAMDIFKWWMFMTTDIIGELTFGESFNTLEQAKVAPPPDTQRLFPLYEY
jgi:cytochrome P450